MGQGSTEKEVESKKDGEKINWSEVARRYHVTNKRGEIARNGGQIVQEWLVNQGVNIHLFNPKELPNKLRVRRKKKIGQGGEISIPVPETNNELKEKLKMKITSGEYTVGELIVPRKVISLLILFFLLTLLGLVTIKLQICKKKTTKKQITAELGNAAQKGR